MIALASAPTTKITFAPQSRSPNKTKFITPSCRPHPNPRPSLLSVVCAAATPETADPYADRYPSWDSIYQQINFKYGLRSISPDEAAMLVDQDNAVLVDVRLTDDHTQSHPKGSVSCPAFRIIKAEDGTGLGRMVKALLMKSNGVTPTEAHPDFPSAVATAVGSSGDKAVILMCEAGGTPQATSSFPTGKASRSLKAAWKLLHTGTLPPERVLHLDGGVLGWYKAGLQMEGEYDSSKAGKSPNVVPLNKD